MAYFVVRVDRLNQTSGELHTIYQQITREMGDIDSVRNALAGMSGMGNLRNSLRSLRTTVSTDVNQIRTMADKLSEIVKQYEKTETGLMQQKVATDKNQPSEGNNSKEVSWWDAIWEYWENIVSNNKNDPEMFQNIITFGFLSAMFPDISDTYVGKSLKQAICGNFTEDSNFLGIVLSVAIGFIPVVGQIADVRDVIADIGKLIDDGPEAEEWVSLGISIIGIIPVVGDIAKNADKIVAGVAKLGKHGPDMAKQVQKMFRNIDEVTDYISNTKVVKHLDEIGKRVDNYVDEIGKKVNEHIVEPIAKQVDKYVGPMIDRVDNYVNNIPGVQHIRNKVDEILGKKVIKDKDLGEAGKETIQKTIDKVIQNNILDWVKEKRESLATT
ncbi:MAG: hypothetical protein IKM28_05650 [Lachnospiraceae bacterium]|nr:hypothetical protein [Lachnospiraceae bacterium]